MNWDSFSATICSPLAISAVVFGGAICYFVYRYIDNLNYWERRGVPSPRGNWPVLGHVRYMPNMFMMLRNFIGQFQTWTGELGKYYGVFEGQRKVFVTSDPELIQQICIKQFSNFKFRSVNHEHILQQEERDNIFTAHVNWKEKRTETLHAFQMSLSTIIIPLVIDSTKAAIVECKRENKQRIEQCIERIEQHFLARLAYLHIHGCCNKKALTEIMEQPGYKDHEQMAKYANMVANLYNSNVRRVADWRQGYGYGLAYLFSVCLPGLTKVLHRWVAMRPSPTHILFLALCKQIAMQSGKAEIICNLDQMHDKKSKEICDLAAMDYISSVVFIRAGHELVNIYNQLECHLDVIAQMGAEIKQICGNEPLNYEHIKKLVYMDAAIKECLRLDPSNSQFSGAMKRVCNKTTNLTFTNANGNMKSIEIEEGTEIRPDVFSLHVDPDIWGNDSTAFRPERWLERNVAAPAYLAFGVGPHECVARKLNMLRMKLILTVLFQQQADGN